MIETCLHGIERARIKTKQLSTTPSAIFLYSLTTAAVGIIILLAFCSMLLSPTVLVFLLPAIIAFNSAAAGYGYADKAWTDFPLQKLPLSAIALLLSMAGCFALTLFTPWESMPHWWVILISTSSALIFTFSGAWIAIKNNKLTKSS